MNLKKYLPILLCFLAIAMFMPSCSNPPSEPERTIQQKLQAALDDAFSTYGGKGISAAVVLPDGELWLGNAHIEGSAPIASNQVFWIASITKMFTAALTLQLVDEGKLRLDDPLSKFLPVYPNVDGSITIYQLLTHTSGVFDIPNHPQYDKIINEDPAKIWSPEEIVTRLFAAPYFAPGAGWRYSSGGYVLLGMVIEKVTGNKVSQEFKERFYEPLGLSSTFLDGEEPITAEIANLWADLNEDGMEEEIPVLSVNRLSMTSVAYTAGGLFSTAADVAKWTDALFRRKSVLSQEMLDHMLDFNTDLPPDFKSGWPGYGMGAGIFRRWMVNNAYAYGHGGQGAYYISATAYLSEHDMSVTVLLNSQNWTLWEKSMNALCRAAMEHFHP
jgi:CubicO group peptidase (beta-lactamase class C family)